MGLTKWNDILNKPKSIDNIEEIALEISDLSASVLSISEDVGEIALDVSQLSATVLSIAGDVEDIQEELTIEDKTFTLNSSFFNSEDIDNVVTCQQYGKLVILNITSLKLIDEIVDGNTSVLISGLPAPKNMANFVIFGRVTASGAFEGFRVRLLSTGELIYWYNNANLPTTKTIAGQIMYLTN